MTRIGRDSTVLTDIPVAGTDIPMVYGNGRYAVTYEQVAQRFPGKPILWFDVIGDRPDLDALDVESGDATPQQAPSWAQEHNNLRTGYPAIIYCDRTTETEIRAVMKAAGLKIGLGYCLGISTLDGTTLLPDMTGVTFVQDRGEALTRAHYDESIMVDDRFKPVSVVNSESVITILKYVAGEVKATSSNVDTAIALLGG